MGTPSQAVAITPTLFFGDELDLPHVYTYGDGSGAIRSGDTVRVDSDEWALITLMNLGVSYKDSLGRINQAKTGNPEPGTTDGRRQEEDSP